MLPHWFSPRSRHLIDISSLSHEDFCENFRSSFYNFELETIHPVQFPDLGANLGGCR